MGPDPLTQMLMGGMNQGGKQTGDVAKEVTPPIFNDAAKSAPNPTSMLNPFKMMGGG